MPATVEHYIHRVGRTARAGRVGVSVSLAGEGERRIVKDVIKKASNPVKMRIIATGMLQNPKTPTLNSYYLSFCSLITAVKTCGLGEGDDVWR